MGSDQVHAKLDPKLLTELLKLEQKERQQQLQSQMQKHGIQVPATGSAEGSSSSSSTEGGSGSDSSSSSSGLSPWSGGDSAVDRDDQWRNLLSAAPWLQDDESNQ